jgi:hypothetical protein
MRHACCNARCRLGKHFTGDVSIRCTLQVTVGLLLSTYADVNATCGNRCCGCSAALAAASVVCCTLPYRTSWAALTQRCPTRPMHQVACYRIHKSPQVCTGRGPHVEHCGQGVRCANDAREWGIFAELRTLQDVVALLTICSSEPHAYRTVKHRLKPGWRLRAQFPTVCCKIMSVSLCHYMLLAGANHGH